MFFLTFRNTNILFSKQELISRFYTIANDLANTKWVEFINKKKFGKAEFDENAKVFIVYLTYLSFNLIYLVGKAEIVLLFIKKIMISDKYSAFINVLLEKKGFELLEWTKLN